MTILSASEEVLVAVMAAIALGWVLYRIVERVRTSAFAAAVEALTDRPAALPLDGPWHADRTRKVERAGLEALTEAPREIPKPIWPFEEERQRVLQRRRNQGVA